MEASPDPFADDGDPVPEGVAEGKLEGDNPSEAQADPFDEEAPMEGVLEDPEAEAEAAEPEPEPEPEAGLPDAPGEPAVPAPEEEPEGDDESQSEEPEGESEPEAKPKKRTRKKKTKGDESARNYVLLQADEETGAWIDKGTVPGRNEEAALRAAFDRLEENEARLVVIPERYFRPRDVKAEPVTQTRLTIS